jgi:putative membrane protein
MVSYLFLGGPPPGSGWTAPAFLFIAALLIFILTSPGWRWHLPVAWIIAMAAEFAGLNWGYPFGAYSYTGVLYPSVLGIPLAIGCAWLILFAYAREILSRFNAPAWLRPVIGASWMMASDLLIDPLAAGSLGYWNWFHGGFYYGVPASNFAGWFIVGLGLFLIFRQSPRTNRKVAYAGFSILLFFTLIAIRQLLVGPVIAGAALLILHAFLLHGHQPRAIPEPSLSNNREKSLSLRERYSNIRRTSRCTKSRFANHPPGTE